MSGSLLPNGWRRVFRRAVFWSRYQRWRLAHPGKAFPDYYVHRFLGRLEEPGTHANIGNLPVNPARTRAFATEVLRRLRQLGMQPEHTCADYGCGSLHVGETLIEYLESGRYLGLDVTDAFFNDALTRFDAAWLEHKQPRLERIGASVIQELATEPPDFLVCTHVLILVPPRELAKFARALTSLIGPATRCLLELELRRRPRQPTETFFWHSRERIERAFSREGFTIRTIGRWHAIQVGQRESTLVELTRRG